MDPTSLLVDALATHILTSCEFQGLEKQLTEQFRAVDALRKANIEAFKNKKQGYEVIATEEQDSKSAKIDSDNMSAISGDPLP